MFIEVSLFFSKLQNEKYCFVALLLGGSVPVFDFDSI